MKRTVSVLICAVVLAVFCGTCAIAQVVTTPDEGVRGSGAIYTSTKSVAVFDINVARAGLILSGAFKYSVPATTYDRGTTIYSQRITGLKIVGNTATITAVGYWNSMQANITIEVLDDLNMDWFRITAVPQGPMLIVYNEAGGLIKGDIVVYTKPVPSGYVKGEGIIPVGKNAGRFRMYAEKVGTAVKGEIYFYEYNPMVMSIMERPIVKIYVPAVQRIEFNGIYATLRGKGTINGRPAMVEVKAMDADLANWLVETKDHFTITATPLLSDSLNSFSYTADGDVITGDITIKADSITR